MALKTIQDYERAGQQDARNPDGPVRFKRSATSWQAQYYWRGFDSVKTENGPKAKLPLNIEGTASGRVGSVFTNTANIPKSLPSVLRVLGPLYGPRSKPKNLFNRKQA